MTVKVVERLTPRVVRVTFTGEELDGFGPAKPGAHLKLILAELPPGVELGQDQPRPPMRTYTPRSFDPASNELVIDFVLHGTGLAADWVRRAQPGEHLAVAGPGGGFEIPDDTRHIVIVADETSMPAAGTVLEALPTGCAATVYCEIEDRAERRPLSPTVEVTPTWLQRADTGAVPGSLLEQAVRACEPGQDSYWWIACEAAAMRRIRRSLVDERGIDKARVHTRGYWKFGETNYPDHDYGEE